MVQEHALELVSDTGGVHGLEVETGSFTPALVGSSVAGSPSYKSRYGYYQRIGNWVTVSIFIAIELRSGVATGDVYITGLPFPVYGTTSSFRSVLNFGYSRSLGRSATHPYISAGLAGSESFIRLRQDGDNQAPASVNVSQIYDNTEITISGTYRIA